VHFPIALLLAALVAEFVAAARSSVTGDGPSATGFFCLALGNRGALAAAASGWLFAAHDPPACPSSCCATAGRARCAARRGHVRFRPGAGGARGARTSRGRRASGSRSPRSWWV
jgi:hypothetical protein